MRLCKKQKNEEQYTQEEYPVTREREQETYTVILDKNAISRDPRIVFEEANFFYNALRKEIREELRKNQSHQKQ